MYFIYFFIVILLLFYSTSSKSHPWVSEKGKYHILFSGKLYFTKLPSIISEQKYLSQKKLTDSLLKIQNTISRKKKLQLEKYVKKIEKDSKKLFDYYEIYEQYLHIDYGITKKTTISLDSNIYKMGSFDSTKSLNKIIVSPYIMYNIYKNHMFDITLSSKFNNIFFQHRNRQSIDIGISIGHSQKKKGQKKYFTYYDFNFSPNNSYHFTLGNGIETQNGYLGVISTSYFKTINSYKDVHSDKIRGEIFLAKTINRYHKKSLSLVMFISYFAEYSKYANLNVASGMQMGFYFK